MGTSYDETITASANVENNVNVCTSPKISGSK